MSVAKVIELSSTSTKSFEEAVEQGIHRACKTLENVTSVWIKEQRAMIQNNKVTSYQVNILVTFVLKD